MTFHILVALVDGDRHGYAIIREIAERTDGEIEIQAGTLYRSIGRMLEQGLVSETRTRPAIGEDDERRRYYRITPFGRAVAQAEARRLTQMVRLARASGLVPAQGLTDAPRVVVSRALAALSDVVPRRVGRRDVARARGAARADARARRRSRSSPPSWPMRRRTALRAQWDVLRQDLGYALRTLRRTPGFTTTVMLVDGARHRRQHGRLHRHRLRAPAAAAVRRLGSVDGAVAVAGRRAWPLGGVADQLSRVEEGARVRVDGRRPGTSRPNLVGRGEPQRLDGAALTADDAAAARCAPALGRVFTADDDRDGAPGTVLLSWGLWQTAFGGDAGVLGSA